MFIIARDYVETGCVCVCVRERVWGGGRESKGTLRGLFLVGLAQQFNI